MLKFQLIQHYRHEGGVMSQQPWQSYWQSHTTANSFLHEYESGDGPYGVIADYWTHIFAQFGANEQVIDLGAGNGALSHLYVRQFPQPVIASWQNIDFAHIQCDTAHACVKHIQADMHALPLPEESVQHAISMYGIEYSNLPQSMREISRVLSSNGQVHCLLHHPDSIISLQSRTTINVSEAMLQTDMLSAPQTLSQLSYAQIKQHCLSTLNGQLQSVTSNAQEDVKLIGQNVFNILQFNRSVLDICNKLGQLSVALHTQSARLTQQLNAASHAQVFFETQGHEEILLKNHSLELLTYNENPIAYAFSGIK